MLQNKQYFLDFLNGCGSRAVIFEPFISHLHTETLIWRRGTHLWETPGEYLKTLFELSHRTLADVVFCDIREYSDEDKKRLFCEMKAYSHYNIGIGIICNDSDDIKAAECSDVVCVICAYGDISSDILPVIRMDGTLENAIAGGYKGWFATNDAEKYLEYSEGKIKILGGLGREFILRGSPVDTYSEVERLYGKYAKNWACGSGFEIPSDNYLELISLLGAFGRIR